MKGINREKLYEEMLCRLCEGQKATEKYKECMFQLSNTEKLPHIIATIICPITSIIIMSSFSLN